VNPLLIIGARVSFKYEAIIIGSILTFLLFMPIMCVFALTKISTPKEASSLSTITSYPGDYYDWGNCTWWVSMLRAQAGDKIPNSWGNAATWATRAAADGYLVDQTPTAGSIMQISNVDHGLGHVAYVQTVDPDGTWHISEMNVLGLDVVDQKTEPASAASVYEFIHDKED
jgi:peptidoglycan endopeptidase LytE